MAGHYDVIVVGSGFGGAVTACRLAQAGRKVLVLERGREWTPQDYPRAADDAWIWDDTRPERRNGWIDLRFFGDMSVVQGAGVGGGSLIYANIFVEAEPFVFEKGWPAGITYEALKPHYETTGRMLDVHDLPDNQLTERFKLMREGAQKIGAGERFRKLPLAVTFDEDWSYALPDPHHPRHSRTWTNAQGRSQGTCVHCGNCDIGCGVRAKNTLDLNYLAAAIDAGAVIRANHIVRSLRPVPDAGFIVRVDRIEGGRLVPDDFAADKVVLAAGSLGTTELLLRCRDEYRALTGLSDRLGHGWCSNGDFLTPAIYRDRRVSPTRGPTITCAIDFLDGSEDGNRFFVEDGGFPDVVGNSIDEAARVFGAANIELGNLFLKVKDKMDRRDALSFVMPWFGQAIDAASGTFSLRKPWWKFWGSRQLHLDWPYKPSERAVQALADMHDKLSRATGGIPLEPPSWSVLHNLITPHPLGGCAMADSPRDGVVDARGRVFGQPGLYIADGSIFPGAVGLNPSRTIAALAEHIAAAMIAEPDA